VKRPLPQPQCEEIEERNSLSPNPNAKKPKRGMASPPTPLRRERGVI